MEPRRTHKGRVDADRGNQWQIAKELDRVAEAVIVEHQHPLASPFRPPPGLEARSERLTERLSVEPARLVAFESVFEVSERQHQAALARDSLAAAERRGGVERGHSLGETAKAPQRERLTQQRLGHARPRDTRPDVGVQRLLAAIELQQRIADIDRGLGEIMTQGESVLSRFERFLEAPELTQRSGAAAPGVRIMRRERCRRGEGSECVSEAAGADQELAEIEVGDDQ